MAFERMAEMWRADGADAKLAAISATYAAVLAMGQAYPEYLGALAGAITAMWLWGWCWGRSAREFRLRAGLRRWWR